MKPRELVVSCGDPQGIGPEVSVSAALERTRLHPEESIVLTGVAAQLESLGAVVARTTLEEEPRQGVRILDAECAMPSGAGPSDAGGRVALLTLERALARVRRTGGALVTAPLAKSNVALHAPGFHGHTEWLAAAVGGEPLMLFSAPGLKLALATVHVPLAEVPRLVREGAVLGALRKLQQGLSASYRITSPRLMVLGLNPHAGEGGLLGREELEHIVPDVAAARAEGIDALGPFSADGFFAAERWRTADAVLALYHDQGLVALKALCFGRAVNVTLGLPVIRTSVDHGCAFDLAGRGVADHRSMAAALAEARVLLDFRSAV